MPGDAHAFSRSHSAEMACVASGVAGDDDGEEHAAVSSAIVSDRSTHWTTYAEIVIRSAAASFRRRAANAGLRRSLTCLVVRPDSLLILRA